jgi:hypothetical protein
VDLVEKFQLQAQECEDLGSPMYASLLRRIVDDYELGGVSTQVLAGFDSDRLALALPLLGAVHRLVLGGEVPELAVFYPSVGGSWDPVLGWEAFEQVLQSRSGELRALLLQAPQTNEVGRSTALYGGLLQLVEAFPVPVRLFEIGSSAGLNLRADQFRYELGDGTVFGVADSPVQIPFAWSGRAVAPQPSLRIAERVGSDIAPVDVLSSSGELLLTSYIWPDMTERLERLRGAISLARSVPADVRREDAVSFLRGLELSEGHMTVIWHSVMWHYLSPSDQEEADAVIAALGARATDSAPLARLTLEQGRGETDWLAKFPVVLQIWPGGEARTLGHATPHGAALVWE